MQPHLKRKHQLQFGNGVRTSAVYEVVDTSIHLHSDFNLHYRLVDHAFNISCHLGLFLFKMKYFHNYNKKKLYASRNMGTSKCNLAKCTLYYRTVCLPLRINIICK